MWVDPRSNVSIPNSTNWGLQILQKNHKHFPRNPWVFHLKIAGSPGYPADFPPISPGTGRTEVTIRWLMSHVYGDPKILEGVRAEVAELLQRKARGNETWAEGILTHFFKKNHDYDSYHHSSYCYYY